METRVVVLPKKTPEVLLMPIGDIQWAGAGQDVAVDMVQRHIAWGVGHGAYFVGMGDYIDFASPSNRQALNSAKTYDSTREELAGTAQNLVSELVQRVLKPSIGRWLGLVHGHHYFPYEDGTISDQDLAERLQCPYLGTMARLHLVFPEAADHEVVIWVHHGVGYNLMLGGALNNLERLSGKFDAQVFLMGHQTKKVAAVGDRITYLRSGNDIVDVHQSVVLACTGGFMRGYTQGRMVGKRPTGSYVEQRALPPVGLGGVLVKIRPRWEDHKIGSKTVRFWNPDINVEL